MRWISDGDGESASGMWQLEWHLTMSAVSMEQTNALKHAELFKSKPFLGGHREQSSCYFSGKSELRIRKCSIESIKPGAKGSAGSAYVAIFALRSSEVTSFITWFILGSITRDAWGFAALSSLASVSSTWRSRCPCSTNTGLEILEMRWPGLYENALIKNPWTAGLKILCSAGWIFVI